MKKINFILVSTIALLFTSCNDNTITEKNIVGDWKWITVEEHVLDADITILRHITNDPEKLVDTSGDVLMNTYFNAGTLHLKEDGTGSVFGDDGSWWLSKDEYMRIRWSMSDDKLIIIDDESESITYTIKSLNGNTLILSDFYSEAIKEPLEGEEEDIIGKVIKYRFDFRLERY